MVQTKKKTQKSTLRNGNVIRKASLKLEFEIEGKPEQDWDFIESESIIRNNWRKYSVLPQRGDFISDDGGYVYRIIGLQWSHDLVTIWLRDDLR